MFDKVKESLRIRNNKSDIEINDLIESAKSDLRISGIKRIIDTDPLIIQAIKFYCKANFGLDSQESIRYQASYDSLKNHLSLCGDYNE